MESIDPAPTAPLFPSSRSVPSWLSLSRGQAFAVHLALSVLAFSTLVFVMLRWWFPGELFLVDGGWQGLKIVAAVDLVLGPLLTLILYKPGKRGLALDLSLIAAVQIAALAYGFVTTWQQRTVAVVYADRAFTTLSASDEREAAAKLLSRDIEPGDIGAIVAGTSQASRAVPLLLTPDPFPGGFGRYLEDLFNGFPETHARSDLYTVPAGGDAALLERALSLEDLQAEGEREAVESALAKRSPGTTDSIALHRFRARYADGIALYDAAAARIVDYVPEPDGGWVQNPPAASRMADGGV